MKYEQDEDFEYNGNHFANDVWAVFNRAFLSLVVIVAFVMVSLGY